MSTAQDLVSSRNFASPLAQLSLGGGSNASLFEIHVLLGETDGPLVCFIIVFLIISSLPNR